MKSELQLFDEATEYIYKFCCQLVDPRNYNKEKPGWYNIDCYNEELIEAYELKEFKPFYTDEEVKKLQDYIKQLTELTDTIGEDGATIGVQSWYDFLYNMFHIYEYSTNLDSDDYAHNINASFSSSLDEVAYNYNLYNPMVKLVISEQTAKELRRLIFLVVDCSGVDVGNVLFDC